uniref:tetracycline destructase Tet(53) n=1 Tax=uncultured bacterium TaxID=77133 RepID=UPI00065F2AF2|nr:tetracycline destructase Tet(53) [uncultured bacterium]AKQ05897.1 tetracycline destructase Tet(53) [uncultured bacterium]
MSTINKILVIGAGIAGPAVCYWLRRFGFSPVLIEKFANIRKEGQALDFRGVAIDIVKGMNIYEKMCNMHKQLEVGRYVDTEGNTLHEERGERFCFRQGEDVEIARGDFAEILTGAIEGIPCHFNQVIDSIKQSDDDVKVQFNDGRVEHYDLVIGADGIYSTTRGMVFDKDEYKLVNLGVCFGVFSILNYLNLSHTEVQCEANQKLISIWSHKNPKMAEVAFVFRTQNVLNNIRNKNEQQQLLRDAFQDFGWEASKILELMTGSDDFYFDSATQVKMKSWTKGRVALLGDAGYSASPLSGQGNYLALVGAYIFAGELKKADGNYTRAFSRYNELLHPLVEACHKLGVLVSESFLVPDEVSKEVAEERSNKILQEVKIVSNMISLPEYE